MLACEPDHRSRPTSRWSRRRFAPRLIGTPLGRRTAAGPCAQGGPHYTGGTHLHGQSACSSLAGLGPYSTTRGERRAVPRLDAGRRTVEDQPVPPPKAKPSAPTADEVPVTRGMLVGVRTEILQRIDQGREGTRAEIRELKAELKGDIHRLDAAIHDVKAEIHDVKAGMARIEVLVEEQNARNRIVLDGITALLSRQNQVEQRVVQVEDTVRKLAVAPPAG
jgi:hypothetical protein